MSDAKPGPPARSTRGLWAVVAVLLSIGIVVPLLVGIYDRTDPTLWGFPFYFWFQFAMIPVVSLLTFIAFKISQKATEHDRQRFGLSARPEGDR